MTLKTLQQSMHRLPKYIALAIATMFAAAGCIAPQSVVMADDDPQGWDKPVTLTVRNDDTLSLRTLSVVLRYNGDFRCDSLPLDIAVSLPDAGQFAEEIVLRPEYPYSPAAVSATENIVWRRRSTLGQSGWYLFTIRPAQPVRGIEAVGIDIEKE